MLRPRQELSPPSKAGVPTSSSLRGFGRESTLGGLRRQGKLCNQEGSAQPPRGGERIPSNSSACDRASLSPHVAAALW